MSALLSTPPQPPAQALLLFSLLLPLSGCCLGFKGAGYDIDVSCTAEHSTVTSDLHFDLVQVSVLAVVYC